MYTSRLTHISQGKVYIMEFLLERHTIKAQCTVWCTLMFQYYVLYIANRLN